METPALGKGEVMCAGDIHSASGRVLGVRLSPLDDPHLLLCVQDGQLQRWEVRVMQGVRGA